MRTGWWVVSPVAFGDAAEVNDALASAIDLRWVAPSCQLEGLANGTDCSVNRLRSDLTAASEVSLPHPVSKGAEDVRGRLFGTSREEFVDVPFRRESLPVTPVCFSSVVVHCAMVNCNPRRVETTFEIASVGRVTIVQR